MGAKLNLQILGIDKLGTVSTHLIYDVNIVPIQLKPIE